jgi:hypothetical protein
MYESLVAHNHIHFSDLQESSLALGHLALRTGAESVLAIGLHAFT